MIDQPFDKFVATLAARTPTPGGGAAAAMTACLGTALFLMVTRFARGKKQNQAREADLARVEGLLADHLARMLPMAERDCRSFDLVSKAFGMPKDGAQAQAMRTRAIQEAMVGAMAVPEEMLCMVRDVFQSMSKVVDCVARNIVSDLATGGALLAAAGEGAFLNVRINAAYLENKELAGKAMERAQAVLQEIRAHQQSITGVVEKLLA
jgi:formiminotetrahydrofolate cyclodeaminase